MSYNNPDEKCPTCGGEVFIAQGVVENTHVVGLDDGFTVMVDVDAYCEKCDTSYRARYEFDVRDANFVKWLTVGEVFEFEVD